MTEIYEEEDIYITINIEEGKVYSKYRLMPTNLLTRRDFIEEKDFDKYYEELRALGYTSFYYFGID